MAIEVPLSALQAGDRILAIRTPGEGEFRADNVITAPEGPHANGNLHIRVKPTGGRTRAPGVEWNFWRGTEYTAHSVFLVER